MGVNRKSLRRSDCAARVEDALELVLRAISRRPAEWVPLSNAAGRVLAEPIEATEDLWPFARAAMDGVAVRASDVLAASDGSPVALRVAGAIYSGQVWPSPLEPGTAVRIATGAPTPGGADAVVPQELLEWRRDEVLVSCPIARGRHIFPAGEDAHAGEVILQAGTVLNGGDVSLLAALGHSLVSVVKKATVAILACGDELIAPSAVLQPGQVRESNCYALAAEAAALGAEPRLLGIARDTDPDLNLKIQEGLNADALIVCGGLSVGERDLVKGALQRAGVVLQFAGVSMKPGAPAVFGLAGGRPVFGLPGTPGAARIAFEVLVRPALCAM
jgi:molybdopterin molybdotransferase